MRLRAATLILAATVLSAHAQVLGEVSADHIPAGNPLWGIPLKDLSATRERPIFSLSRRPPPVVTPVVREVAAPKPAEPDQPQLTLVGTVVGDQEAIAILVDPATKNALHLKIGEEHEGWVLQSVRARDATFQKDRKDAVLTMPKPEGGQALLVATHSELPPAQHKRFIYGH